MLKARMTANFAGPDVSISIGDIVEGEEAKRFLEAGYAVPVMEEPAKRETATVSKAKVEKRSK